MSAILSFAGWTFIPNLASGFLHNGLLQLLPLARPGSAGYARDRKVIYVLVVLSYLAYTLVTAYLSIEPNYYDLLQVPIDADEKQLRRAFRRVSATHHPDKGGDDALFRALRVAYDALSNPTRRFAYDRFGPQILAWDKLMALSDYMYHGLLAHIPFYLGSTFFILVLGYVQNSHGMYWRVLSFLTLIAVNASILVQASRIQSLAYILPRFVQFQQTALLQSLCITLLIAISQIGPVLFPPQQDPTSSDAIMETAALARLCSAEAAQALQMTHLPFPNGNTRTTELHTKTAEWMVQARIDQDPEVVAIKSQLLQTRQG